MKKFLVLLLIISSTVLTPVLADEAEAEEELLSAKELLAGCEEGAMPGAPNQYCMQYVFGLVQTIVALQASDPSQPQMFCINPQLVGLPEVTENMTKWLRTKPDRLNEDAYILVSEALASLYPCQSQAF